MENLTLIFRFMSRQVRFLLEVCVCILFCIPCLIFPVIGLFSTVPLGMITEIVGFALCKSIQYLFVHDIFPRKSHDNFRVYNLTLVRTIVLMGSVVLIPCINIQIILIAWYFDISMCILVVSIGMSFFETITRTVITITVFTALSGCTTLFLQMGGDVPIVLCHFSLMYHICFIKVIIFLTVWFCNIFVIAAIQIWQYFLKFRSYLFIQLGFKLSLTYMMNEVKVFKKQLIKCVALIILWYLCTQLNWPQSIEWLHLSDKYIFICRNIIIYEMCGIVYQDSSYILTTWSNDFTMKPPFVTASLRIDKFNGRGILLQNVVHPMSHTIFSWNLLKESCCDFMYGITYRKLFNRKTASDSLHSSLNNLETIMENNEKQNFIHLCAKALETNILYLGLIVLPEQTFHNIPRAIQANNSSVTSYPNSSITSDPLSQDNNNRYCGSLVNNSATCYEQPSYHNSTMPLNDGNQFNRQLDNNSGEHNKDERSQSGILTIRRKRKRRLDIMEHMAENCLDGSLDNNKKQNEDECSQSDIPSIRRKPQRRLDMIESSSLSDLADTVDKVSGRRCDNKYHVEDLRDL